MKKRKFFESVRKFCAGISICALFFAAGYGMGVKESVARGLAIGTSSRALGTARALELGETEGAMSSLSLVVSGLMTVVGASVFAQFM